MSRTIVVGMPRARRRRSRSAARRSSGRTVLITVLIAFGAIVVVGSLAEIHAQSSGYRASTNGGYAAMATRLVEASNLTGTQLATLVHDAPTLPNTYFGITAIHKSARAVLQQGLDQAVADSAREATQTAQRTPPEPTGGVGDRLARVMAARAAATEQVRTAIDQLLGMTPIPVAGAPLASLPAGAAPLISTDQASAALGAAGQGFEQADADYRALSSVARAQGTPMHLPGSAWVRSPVQTAPLGADQLTAAAATLSTSSALQPDHRLLIVSVGLDPPAIATGGPGTVPGPSGNSCGNPQSIVPGPAPTMLPPTATVTAAVTVTNCGTVDESGIRVTQSLVLADPPGTALPPPGAGGGQAQATIGVPAGRSSSVTLPAATVTTGHTYTLTFSVAPAVSAGPPLPGATQEFVIRIAP